MTLGEFNIVDLKAFVVAESDLHSVVLIIRPYEGGEGEAVGGIGEGDAEEGFLAHSDWDFWLNSVLYIANSVPNLLADRFFLKFFDNGANDDKEKESAEEGEGEGVCEL